jgi:tetratricopeptide (TPR) repeat protein
MKDAAIRGAGLLVTALYAGFITWVYAYQPRTVAQLTGGMAASVGAYQVDRASFNQGLQFFRNDQFEEARAALGRADPARQDPTTQFYVAYGYYRQGWGRMYNDDALFAKGLEAVEHAIAIAPGHRLDVPDPSIQMRTADELRAELKRGLTRDVTDFDPRRFLRERK